MSDREDDSAQDDRGASVTRPPRIDTRLTAILFAIAFCVIAFGREVVTWIRGADPNFGRAGFLCAVGVLIIAAAYRGHTRGHNRPSVSEWIQAAVGFIALSMVFLLFGLVLRAEASFVVPAAFVSGAALTLTIVVRRTAWFFLLAPLMCGVIGMLVSPLLSIFFLNPDVSPYDGFGYGMVVGFIAAVPPWYMFRTAGAAGPQTMTIALLIALLLIPWIVMTAAVR